MNGDHLVGPFGGGFRAKGPTCPAKLGGPEIEGAIEDLLSTAMFPGVPLEGRCLDDMDNRRLEALRIVKSEEPYIRAAILEAERQAHKTGKAG